MTATARLYLEADSVQSALTAMLYARPLGKNHPLHQFINLKQSLGDTASDAAIFDGLSRVIRQGLKHHRKVQPRLPVNPQPDSTVLQEDFRTDNKELKAWSLLYYHYVRVDLGYSFETIETLTAESRRNLRRRQRLGVARLTELLLRRERRARQKERQVVLRAQLPSFHAPPLFGRDAEKLAGIEALTKGPRHLLLSGSPGIGKTALAHTLALQLIDSAPLGNLVWIDCAESELERTTNPKLILERIALQLGVSDTERVSLPAYLAVNDTLIVLDHVDALLNEHRQLDQVLAAISPARVILCVTMSSPEMPAGFTALNLAQLDKEAAFQLMECHNIERGQAEDLVTPERMERLYNDLGGNPRALRFAIGMGHHYNADRIAAQTYDAFWKEVSTEARQLWLMLALRLGVLDMDTLVDWAPNTPTQTIEQLNQCFVVDIVINPQPSNPSEAQRCWQLVPLARTFGLWMMRHREWQAAAHIAVGRVADSLTRAKTTHADDCVFLLDQVQYTLLPIAFQLDLAYAFAPLIERAGAWSAWSRYLAPLRDGLPQHSEDRLWVELHLGTAQRWLAQWKDAAYHLSAVVEGAGTIGKFDVQASALVELAAVYRFEGDLDTADQLLNHAENYYFQQRALEGVERVLYARLQLLLQKNQLDDAATMLLEIQHMLNVENVIDLPPRLVALAAQIALRQSKPLDALRYATAAQRGFEGDVPNLARLAALMAQAYYRLAQTVAQPRQNKYYSEALDLMTSALGLMDPTRDPLGHARARLNLALMLVAWGRRRAAAKHLRGLSAELEKLGDYESLQIALHNLDRINRATRQ